MYFIVRQLRSIIRQSHQSWLFYDYAVLVGISRYWDTNTFPASEGPFWDVDSIRECLLSPLSVAGPSSQVVSLITQETAAPG